MAFNRFTAGFAGLIFASLASFAAPSFARTNHALIVGVTDYPNYVERLWLKGPNNDIALAYNFLMSLEGAAAFDPANIRILMTAKNEVQQTLAGPRNEHPTREAILNALAELAEKAEDGDFVFLHLAGHGSSQLSSDPNETDGRDEVFLPYDAGQPAPDADGVSHYPNAITDNDFALALNAIRAKGADVWAVFDFCHSGSVTRDVALDEREMDRELDMVRDFGVSPDQAPAEPEEASRALEAPLSLGGLEGPEASYDATVPLAPGVDEPGTLVAFFAAQNSETTKEKLFLDEETQMAVPYGIFSRALYTALATNRHPDLTYRQLADSIFQTYLGWNRTTPTPMFEGNLDFAIMGTDVSNPRMQWLVRADNGTITVPAGRLHGLTEGAELLALPSAVSEPEDAIAVFRVASANALSSTLMLAGGEGRVADVAELPVGTFARLATVDYAFALTVARPEVTGTADQAEVDRINAALDAIAADRSGQLRVALVDADAPEADLRLALMSNIEFAQRDGGPVPTGDPSPTLVLMDDRIDATFARPASPPQMTLAPSADGTAFEARLRNNLTIIYRAMGLSRLAGAGTYPPDAFELTYYVQRGGKDTVEAVTVDAPLNLQPADVVYAYFRNNTQISMDVNILYLETDYEIKHACRARIGGGEHIFEPLIRLSPEDVGKERLITVVTEGGDRRQEDLSYLAQTGITRAFGELPGGLNGLLAQLGDGQLTRGDLIAPTAAAQEPLGAIAAFPMTIVPLAEGEVMAQSFVAPVNGPDPKVGCQR